ncbi:hypothetical protein BDV93DRAFT_610437 [Ceratobasidium sp. AG-I]|nr:hypothetical protein BDV93DRAFT_610437 [Ceratobasidium sp. AG-I]
MAPRTRSKTVLEVTTLADSTPSFESESMSNGDSLEEYASGNGGNPPQRKRRQTGKPIDSKPKIRRKIGRLEEIINMPLEIFTEIASHLKLDDLVSLSRASKLLRGTLMTRSAIGIWRAAERNVEGLPLCPPDLNYPQYAVLLFFKSCSICGNVTTRNLIFGLRARLCSDCAADQIVTIESVSDVELIPVVSVPRSRKFRYLKQDWDKMIKSRLLVATHSEMALVKWEIETRLNLVQHAEQTKIVEAYITQVEAKRVQEIASLKAQRDKGARTRLLALGWGQNEVERIALTRAWKWYVLEPKPLTDRIWNHVYSNILGTLLILRGQDPASLVQKRLIDRQEHLHRLLAGIRIVSPPLVDVMVPDTPRRLGPAHEEPYLHFNLDRNDTADAPFPTTTEVLTWPLLSSLVERDVPKEEMEVVFNKGRDEVGRIIRDWQTRVDDEVMDIWREGHLNEDPGDRGMSEPAQDSPSFKVVGALPACTLVFGKPDGSTTSDINDLPETHQLLLRADTIFKQIAVKEQRSVVTHPLGPYAYPKLLPQPCSVRILEALYQGNIWDSPLWAPYPEAEELARGLLQHLGRPNATHAEMDALRLRFFCMRCSSNEIKSWDGLLEHFLDEHQAYLSTHEGLKSHPDRESIVFRNNHDVGGPLDRPLVKVISRQEFEEYVCSLSVYQDDWVSCNICERLSISRYGYLPGILIHLQDVHEIPEPVVGQYYTTRRTKGDYI